MPANIADVIGREPSEVMGLFRGDPHSPVTLIYQRNPTSDPLVITLLRAILSGNSSAPAAARSPSPVKQQQQHASSTPSAVATRAVTIHHEHRPAHDYEDVDPEDSVGMLRNEFATMSFLWGEPINDPGVAALIDWKDELLYGEVRFAPPDDTYGHSFFLTACYARRGGSAVVTCN